jgi:hypothetical protein
MGLDSMIPISVEEYAMRCDAMQHTDSGGMQTWNMTDGGWLCYLDYLSDYGVVDIKP